MPADISQWVRVRRVERSPGVFVEELEVDPNAPPGVQSAVASANRASTDLGGIGGLGAQQAFNAASANYRGEATPAMGMGAPLPASVLYEQPPEDDPMAFINQPYVPPAAPVQRPTVPSGPGGLPYNIAPSTPMTQPVGVPTVPGPTMTQPPRMGLAQPGVAAAPGGANTAALPTMATPEGMRDLYSEGANTLQAQIALAPNQWSAYNQYAPLYAQTDLNVLRNTLFGSVDAGQFLAAHPEFQEGYNNAGGLNGGQQWLDQAVNSSTYLDQATIPRGGGLMGINQAVTQAASEQSQRANTAQRTADINDVRNLGGQAQQLYQDANSQMFGWRNAISDKALRGLAPTDAYNQMAGIASQGFGQINPGQVRDVGMNFASPTIGAPNSFQAVQAQTGDAGLLSAAGSLGYGGSDIQRTLEQQALEGLQLGRGLSAEQSRDATQAAREAFSARGLINSNAAIGQEVLNRDAVARQREAERRAFAQQVDATGFGQRQQGFQNALGYSGAAQNYAGMDLQAQQANQNMGLQYGQLGVQAGQANQAAQLATNQLNQQGALANQQADLSRNYQQLQFGDFNRQSQQNQFGNLGMVNQAEMARRAQEDANYQQAFQNFVGTQYDPFQGVLGRTSTNQGSNAGLFGAGAGTAANSQNAMNQFNPYTQYAGDLYNTNFNANQANQISGRNNSAGLWGAALGAVGTVFGGPIGGMVGSYVGKKIGG